jgi:hypothetical protein
MCCQQLSRSFDFANSICGLLVNHLANSRAYNSRETIGHGSLLSSSSFKIAFNVLNKLTNGNKLFSIDLNVKELCLYLVDGVQSQAEYQSVYLQFLSNILRNNSDEIVTILKSHEKHLAFCRQLIKNIQNNQNPNLTLTSLIIFNKLNINNMFSVLWPAKKTTTSKSKATNELENYKIFDSIDLALTVLCNDYSNGSSRNDKATDKPNELINEKINALNFLHDFLTCETIRILLEK